MFTIEQSTKKFAMVSLTIISLLLSIIHSPALIISSPYYFANGERIAEKDSSGNLLWYHSDHLGSTNVISNSSGGLVETTKYYPFGAIRSGGEENKYYFTGKEKDLVTGLYYYGARYYNPIIRRWVQPDPIVQNPFDPQNLNRYSYVRNNPLRYTDPTGNYFESALDVAFIGWDIHDISQDPGNLWNWGALAVDVVCLAVPIATGGGRVVKAIEHGKILGRLLRK